VAGEAFELLVERAAFWPAQGTLLIADVHLGKSAALRAAGIGVPEGIAADLARISDLIERTTASRLILLGDLFHAPEGQSPVVRATLETWRRSHDEIEMIVTRGNHDRQCEALLARCEIGFEDKVELSGLQLEHVVDPAQSRRGAYRIGGHLHPAVRIADNTRSFRLPCYWFGESDGALPAFGEFTGTHAIERVKGDRVFAIAEDRVVEL
jgi:DNA ligase-associated metallophosphoesterase